MRGKMVSCVIGLAVTSGISGAFAASLDAIAVLPDYVPAVNGGVKNCYASSALALSPDGRYAVGYVKGDIYWDGVLYEANQQIPIYWSKATGTVRQHEDWRHGAWSGVGQAGKMAGTISERARGDVLGADSEYDLPPTPVNGNPQCESAGMNAVSGNDQWMVGWGVGNYADKAIRQNAGASPVTYVTRQGTGSTWFTGVANSGACSGTDAHGTGGPSTDGAIYWDGTSAGVTNIPALTGFSWTTGQGTGISDNGSFVTGYLYQTTGVYRAFRWSPGDASSTALSPLAGDTISWGGDAADNGAVVGWSYSSATSNRACIWDASGQAHLLWDVLVAAGVDMTGWSKLTTAYSITPDGKYVSGYGTYNGKTEGFVAMIPEPASVILIGVGGLLLRRRQPRASVR